MSLCSFPIDVSLPSCLLLGGPGRRGRSACVRDAQSEGTRCQRAAWPAATASGAGGAQGGGPARLATSTCVPQPPPVPAQIRPLRRRVRAVLPATCLPVTARPRPLGALGPCPPEDEAPVASRASFPLPLWCTPVPLRAPSEEPPSQAAAIIAPARAAGETSLPHHPPPPTPFQGPFLCDDFRERKSFWRPQGQFSADVSVSPCALSFPFQNTCHF